MTGLDLETVKAFAIALCIGALVGVEREKRKAGGTGSSVAGLRTFILISTAGALASWLAQKPGLAVVYPVAGLALVALLVAGYFLERRERTGDGLGLTTEVAAVVTFLLGSAAMAGAPEAAVALAIVTSAVLALKEPLHALVAKIGEDDLTAVLKLLFASFIVLPVLPNHTVDPWGALNPYKLWWLVILISALSLAGYVAVRWLGAHRGTLLTGLFGGLVSSTAVTLSFSRRAKASPALAQAAVAAILLAWAVMFARVLVEVAVLHAPLVPPLLVPLAAMGVVTLASALVLWRLSRQAGEKDASGDADEVKNPFNLVSAVKFALFFAGILLATKLMQQALPGAGLYLVAVLAGTTDVDAIALSMATEVRDGADVHRAVTAITLAVLSNTVTKCVMVVVLGASAMRVRIIAVSAAVLVAGVVGVLLG